MAVLVTNASIRVLVPAAVTLRFSLASRLGFSRIRMVPVVVEPEVLS
jgi:hypothetical protein